MYEPQRCKEKPVRIRTHVDFIDVWHENVDGRRLGEMKIDSVAILCGIQTMRLMNGSCTMVSASTLLSKWNFSPENGVRYAGPTNDEGRL